MEDVITDFLRMLVLIKSRGVTTQKGKVTGTCSEGTGSSSDLEKPFIWIRLLPFFFSVHSNFVQNFCLPFCLFKPHLQKL